MTDAQGAFPRKWYGAFHPPPNCLWQSGPTLRTLAPENSRSLTGSARQSSLSPIHTAIQILYFYNTKQTFYKGLVSRYNIDAFYRGTTDKEKSAKTNRHGICHRGGWFFYCNLAPLLGELRDTPAKAGWSGERFFISLRSSRCKPAPAGPRPWRRCRRRAH